jgi:vacuole morphology and inheritance protein 14
LEVLAKISSREEYFTNMMRSLIQLYSVDPALLERRSSLITRHLSLFLSPEKIFRAMANILETVEDLEFASVMIQTLNIILLTSSELHEMRCNLKDLMNDTSRDLFTVLYRYVSMYQLVLVLYCLESDCECCFFVGSSWCHNPAATFSLCLLAQAYEHSAALVCKLYGH